MDDDRLATVIPFPVTRARARARPDDAAPDPTALEDYWALVQRLTAERRRLAGDVG